VVLARYMQILSEDFLARVGAPVINIHHLFPPAFAGARAVPAGTSRPRRLRSTIAHPPRSSTARRSDSIYTREGSR
jgi:formyltetrahydrofolate deformylase